MTTCSRVEVPIVRVHKDFHSLFRNSLAGRTSNREKHLENFSKIFLSVLATSPGDLHATWFNRENHVFYIMRAFFWTSFKNFSFFPRISRLFILLSFFSSFKITIFTHNISIFSFTSSPIFKERYEFCFFLNIFYISCHKPPGLCVSVDIYVYNA